MGELPSMPRLWTYPPEIDNHWSWSHDPTEGNIIIETLMKQNRIPVIEAYNKISIAKISKTKEKLRSVNHGKKLRPDIIVQGGVCNGEVKLEERWILQENLVISLADHLTENVGVFPQKKWGIQGKIVTVVT